jgi:hypothetical protein
LVRPATSSGRLELKTIRLDVPFAPGSTGPEVEVLLAEGRAKVRRIDLAAGARIPPCVMKEDVVFTSESSSETVEAPGAVYIPGGDATRSMKAESATRVLAVLCRAGRHEESAE